MQRGDESSGPVFFGSRMLKNRHNVRFEPRWRRKANITMRLTPPARRVHLVPPETARAKMLSGSHGIRVLKASGETSPPAISPLLPQIIPRLSFATC